MLCTFATAVIRLIFTVAFLNEIVNTVTEFQEVATFMRPNCWPRLVCLAYGRKIHLMHTEMLDLPKK